MSQNDSILDLQSICPPDSPFLRMNIQKLQHFAEMGVYQAKKVLQYRIQQISIEKGDKPVIAKHRSAKTTSWTRFLILYDSN